MNKMKSKAGQHNRFLRIITIPIRALCKARDFYVKGISTYADRMNYGNSMAVQVHGLPRSFSVNAAWSDTGDDLRELRRAASARNIGARVDLDSHVKQQLAMAVKAGSRGGSRAMPPRSRSVAMGRINEESPCCYFGDLDNINKMSNIISVKNDMKYPRSRSHSVKRNVF